MATSKGFLDFILEGLSNLDGITFRAMMGEYVIYYRGKIAAYLCDDRLLFKPTPSALKLMPNAKQEPPYEGAKNIILVDNVDDKDFLTELFTSAYDELPAPKKR